MKKFMDVSLAKIFIALIIGCLFIPQTGFTEENNYVLKVGLCDEDLYIKMDSVGWVVARESEIGKEAFRSIYHVALYLKEQKIPTGFFDPGDPIDICDFKNVRPITVLENNKEMNLKFNSSNTENANQNPAGR